MPTNVMGFPSFTVVKFLTTPAPPSIYLLIHSLLQFILRISNTKGHFMYAEKKKTNITNLKKGKQYTTETEWYCAMKKKKVSLPALL